MIALSYVPPEKKQKGGTSGFGDIIYVIAFYVIEISFIFLGIPIIVLAIGVIPIAMYLIITQGGGGEIDWIFYLFGVAIVFFQILGLQYFFKKWILQPQGKTFGEWLRWKFDPVEIRKRRAERIERSKRMDEWYGGMARIKKSNEKIKQEQTLDLRSEWFKDSDDPELSKTSIGIESEYTITLGGSFEIDDPTKENSTEAEGFSFSIQEDEKEPTDEQEKDEV